MPKRNQSTQEIADLFDVDTSTVQGWVKNGCPCDKSNSKGRGRRPVFAYNAGEVASWMKATNRSGKPGRPTTEISEDLKAIKLRKELAMALKYEGENAVRDGKLIDAAMEQQRDIAKITTVRNKLCGLGASLAPQLEGLEGAERQSLIDDAITAILKELSRE